MGARRYIRVVLNVLVTMPLGEARLDRCAPSRPTSPSPPLIRSVPTMRGPTSLRGNRRATSPGRPSSGVQVHMAGVNALQDHPLYANSRIADHPTSGVHAATMPSTR